MRHILACTSKELPLVAFCIPESKSNCEGEQYSWTLICSQPYEQQIGIPQVSDEYCYSSVANNIVLGLLQVSEFSSRREIAVGCR